MIYSNFLMNHAWLVAASFVEWAGRCNTFTLTIL
eukprot:COSAG02_NODE_16455_length_1081_cov_13.866102_2_plen_33_part_01